MLFISATNTNAGKTTCARLLAQYCNACGVRTILLKPIETGVNDTTNPFSDAHLFLQDNRLLDRSLTLKDISFYRYAKASAPLIAQQEENQNAPIDTNDLIQRLQNFTKTYDLVIVEGAGGLCVPITLEENMLDLALQLKAKMLVISHDNLGLINDCLLNDFLLKSHQLDYKIAINLRENNAAFHSVSLPYIELFNERSNNPIVIFQQSLKELMDFALK
ncbi:dethiobiotin synthase [Helicobacter pylori]|uniref:ATP-dependent dethiobiotin synthetase BioD n=1 Tax=Helicobacter pylori Aklavik86 TaxID=1055532 RepID=K7Y692_HELPX|nr:dethiobiotin synthase [Helicobacter pylori]AFX89056.1 dethiobiotin synthetase [Helicobacter pylori Aklavik86]WQS14331.1 dethiobiotin synthase [Helicobacter pylori]WQS24070.1 dethiobiotin synthase [Helicobacter pylori]